MLEREPRSEPMAPPSAAFDPGAYLPELSPEQLALLAQVGRHWRSRVTRRGTWRRALPVRTDLVPYSPRQIGRFAHVEFTPGRAAGELTATPDALVPATLGGRALRRTRRVLIGAPLRSTAIARERMRKLVALPVLSADALSSVAYGPEAMLAILVLAGSRGARATRFRSRRRSPS